MGAADCGTHFIIYISNIPLKSFRTPRGHLTEHIPQLKHTVSSITAQLSTTWMASAVHVLSQIPQPIQLFLQALPASLPFSLLEHFTTI